MALNEWTDQSAEAGSLVKSAIDRRNARSELWQSYARWIEPSPSQIPIEMFCRHSS